MDQQTIDTYERAALAYAEKFAGVGSRAEAVERVLHIWGRENPRVLELGCGDGRDAQVICGLTKRYRGVDAAAAMLALAKQKVPAGTFEQTDMTTFSFAEPVDIIFAFASLLHVNQEVFRNTLRKAHKALSNKGIFYLSVKEGEYRGAEVVTDAWGDRLFYFYREADIRALADGYEVMEVSRLTIGHTPWLDMTLQKK